MTKPFAQVNGSKRIVTRATGHFASRNYTQFISHILQNTDSTTQDVKILNSIPRLLPNSRKSLILTGVCKEMTKKVGVCNSVEGKWSKRFGSNIGDIEF